MARKSYNEKLQNGKDMPAVHDLTEPKDIARYGGTRMLIAPPLAYDEVMKTIPYGELTTSTHIRAYLAGKYDADFTCPLTAGIFINIVANASVERGVDETPYWRTLRKDGELNEKYPGGIDRHKQLLEAEGHTVVQKGKRFFVESFHNKLHNLG